MIDRDLNLERGSSTSPDTMEIKKAQTAKYLTQVIITCLIFCAENSKLAIQSKDYIFLYTGVPD